MTNRKSHLFWAKYGLMEVTGRRGSLYTPLTLINAANFQSNLEGRNWDVSEELMEVLRFPGNSTFLQLCADTPHNKMKPWQQHPVSAEIVTCGLLHKDTTKALKKVGLRYAYHRRELGYKLTGLVPARMEVVTVLTRDRFLERNGRKNRRKGRLGTLMAQRALLLPCHEKVKNPERNFLQGGSRMCPLSCERTSGSQRQKSWPWNIYGQLDCIPDGNCIRGIVLGATHLLG